MIAPSDNGFPGPAVALDGPVPFDAIGIAGDEGQR